MNDELRRLAQSTADGPGAPPPQTQSAQTENAQPKSNIMVVDDQPANLKLLEDLLTQQGHAVRSFPRGRLALDAAARNLPDLILLDINMPEMNGFEVCERLKADEKLAPIPVLFLSALNETKDKVNAFRAGGVDYITKPFQLEEVRARVETHLQLHRARQVERELLERTLNGAVKALSDLAHLTSPTLTQRTGALRSMMVHMSTQMRLADPWQYELAAILCLIGCITLPPDAFEHAYVGEKASAEEQQMYRAHPDVAFRLLSQIPRLENVAEMIRLQQFETSNWGKGVVAEQGSRMLKTAQELDRRTLRGIPFQTACDQLRAAPGKYPTALLDALKDYSPSRVHFEVKRLQAQQLVPGMILDDDVVTENGGLMVISKGTTLTGTLIERVQNFARTRGVREPIQVRAPQGSYAGELQRV
ncbi:MAG TPA: response regulator [Bryobacteraceae bacterium]|jgi:DNA-binding response OmpR family regulator|nr:response regulator [Bryobacteraceae bacterium]